MSVIFKSDFDAWNNCDPQDTWIFNKLHVQRLCGLSCGPKGIPVPKTGWYIVRPIMNLIGLGLGAQKLYLTPEESIDAVPHGHFWCEYLTGMHMSVDFEDYRPVFACRGMKDPTNHFRFQRWYNIDELSQFEKMFPDELKQSLLGDYRTINIEFINDWPIEVHLRANYDFAFVDDFSFVDGHNVVEYNRHIDYIDPLSFEYVFGSSQESLYDQYDAIHQSMEPSIGRYGFGVKFKSGVLKNG